MTARIRLGALELFYMIALSGCSGAATNAGDDTALRASLRTEIEALAAQSTPSTLATAALLSYPPEEDPRRMLQLIQRAETLAPERADLVWVQSAICRRLKCDAERSIESHLKELDPDNGFAWIPDLERAEQTASESAVTEAIALIGAHKKVGFHLNSLQVTIYDALTLTTPTASVASHAIQARGLAVQIIPPLESLTRPCRASQFTLPGRREACAMMMMRMEQSDSVLAQALALSMQRNWWPAGSLEREAVRKRRRQLDYEKQMSAQIRWRMNRDMAIRIDAARRSEREEEVMRAVMQAYGIQLVAPSDWKDQRESL